MANPVVATCKGVPDYFCSLDCVLREGPRRNKFNAKRSWSDVCQRFFDSKHELAICEGLWAQEKAGDIRNLRFQVPYRIEVNGHHVCTYVADAVYEEHHRYCHEDPCPLRCVPVQDDVNPERMIGKSCAFFPWREVCADAKSVKTRTLPVYRLKAKLMAAVLGITVVEL